MKLAQSAAAFLLLFAGGCSSAIESGHNTALDSINLTQMTDQMAASIIADSRVQAAIHEQGTLPVVVEPVQNEMEAEILPRGQAEAFIARVRYLLGRHNGSSFAWVMNKEDFYALRKRELDVPLGPAPEAVNPRYALVARFRSLANETSKVRSDSYLCVYELSDLQTRSILWTDKYEVKKTAVKGFLD